MSVASREAFFTTRCAIGPSQRARERPSASIDWARAPRPSSGSTFLHDRRLLLRRHVRKLGQVERRQIVVGARLDGGVEGVDERLRRLEPILRVASQRALRDLVDLGPEFRPESLNRGGTSFNSFRISSGRSDATKGFMP